MNADGGSSEAHPVTGTRVGRRKRASKRDGGVAIYHLMLTSESFEQCAARLFETVAHAQRVSPGRHRFVFVDVEGHRNNAGGYDTDAFEVINDFAMGFLLPYVTEISTPLHRVRNRNPQNDEIPDILVVSSQPRMRPASTAKSTRRSPPTLARIVEHLGLDEPMCLVCGSSQVERAHIVPHALGDGSELANFALLCPAHHRAAPDVTGPRAFWAWVDAAYSRWNADRRVFTEEVMIELRETFGWTTETFETANNMFKALSEKWQELVDQATTTHFGVGRKPSSIAWALDAAFNEVVGPRSRTI